jgi:hypothetical protein
VGISENAKKEKNFVPRSTDMISPSDDLAIVGKEKNARKLADEYGWQLKDGLKVFAESLSRTNAGMAETLVSPRSEVIRKTMSQIHFKELYGVNPVALSRGNKIFYGGITRIRINMGDTLLLQGPWERFHIIKNSPQPRALTFATPLEGEILRPQKAKLAVVWLALALLKVIVFKIQLSVALMYGALGMIITGVLPVDEAYRGADWMTVFLLAGLIPLGMAFEKTRTAAFITQKVMEFLGHPTPIVLLAAVGVMSPFFTLVISNVGATVLLVPHCMNRAVMAGGDPRMAALVVGLSSSNTFVLPTHQVNALIMRPGGYRTVDYAGHLLIPGIAHVLKVRIIAEMEDRIALLQDRKKMSRDEALGSHVKAALQEICDATVTADDGIVHIQVQGRKLRKTGVTSPKLQIQLKKQIRVDSMREIMEAISGILEITEMNCDIDSPHYH